MPHSLGDISAATTRKEMFSSEMGSIDEQPSNFNVYNNCWVIYLFSGTSPERI